MKNIIIIIIVFMSCSSMKNNNYQEVDYVPNKETAVRIAEAIWLPIYGDKILMNKPYIATLEKGIWIVEGTLPQGTKGGVPYIEIQKSNCKILKVTHGK